MFPSKIALRDRVKMLNLFDNIRYLKPKENIFKPAALIGPEGLF